MKQAGIRIVHSTLGSLKRPYYVLTNGKTLVNEHGNVRRFASEKAAEKAAKAAESAS